MTNKDLYGGLIRLHILHHANQEPIFGAGIADELRRHGYDISPGKLYPMLHSMEEKGYLTSRQELSEQRVRRVYGATSHCRQALAAAKIKVKELFLVNCLMMTCSFSPDKGVSKSLQPCNDRIGSRPASQSLKTGRLKKRRQSTCRSNRRVAAM